MKKKGFTLIELLAVIVILAIIALILVPKISDLIFNVRRQAFRGTVNGIIDSADGYKTEFSFNHITGDFNYPVTFECDGTACKNSSNETLHFKGKAPTGGKVTINKDGILAENLTDGTFCANGSKIDLKITEGCDEPEIVSNPLDPNETYAMRNYRSMEGLCGWEALYQDDFYEDCDRAGTFADASYYTLKNDTPVYAEPNYLSCEEPDYEICYYNNIDTTTPVTTIPAGTVILTNGVFLEDDAETDFIYIYYPSSPDYKYSWDIDTVGIIRKSAIDQDKYELRPVENTPTIGTDGVHFAEWAFIPRMYVDRDAKLALQCCNSADYSYTLHYKVYYDNQDTGIYQIFYSQENGTYDGPVYYIREADINLNIDNVQSVTPYVINPDVRYSLAEKYVFEDGHFVRAGQLGSDPITVTGIIDKNDNYTDILRVEQNGNVYYIDSSITDDYLYNEELYPRSESITNTNSALPIYSYEGNTLYDTGKTISITYGDSFKRLGSLYKTAPDTTWFDWEPIVIDNSDERFGPISEYGESFVVKRSSITY